MAAEGTAGRVTGATGPVAGRWATGRGLRRAGTTCFMASWSMSLVGLDVAPMPWAMPGAGPVVIIARGTMSTARTPP